ncbi:MAG: hypothetical protein LC799_09165 [Actinobacteria bacterium]|nr:hypothetical protein [Actinomycetota bacterium]
MPAHSVRLTGPADRSADKGASVCRLLDPSRSVSRVGAVEGNSSEAPTVEELAAAAAVLHRVLAEVDTGRLPADLDHAAYLRGAANTLSLLAGGCVNTKVSTHGDDAEIDGAFHHDS